MGSSSYLKAPDPLNAGRAVFVQFKYGFLREIEYEIGDAIVWEKDELPANTDTQGDAMVPAWSLDDDRHFLLTIERNRIVGLEIISRSECDRLLDENFERTSRHVWKK